MLRPSLNLLRQKIRIRSTYSTSFITFTVITLGELLNPESQQNSIICCRTLEFYMKDLSKLGGEKIAF